MAYPPEPPPTLPAPPPTDAARTAYREGFRDGFDEGYDKGSRQPRAPGGPAAEGKDDGKEADRQQGPAQGKPGEGDAPKDDEQARGKDPHRKPLYRRPVVVGVVLLVLLLLIIGGIVFWRHSRHHESTDDAFIDGQTSRIAAQTNGRVTRLLVNDNQHVKPGDVLVEIDDRDNASRREQARAQVATAEGQVQQARAQVDVRRAAEVQAAASVRQAAAEAAKADQDRARFRNVDPQAVAGQQVDSAEAQARSAHAQLDAARSSALSAKAQTAAALAQVRAAEAQLQAARAEVQAAELQLSYNRVVATVAGRVSRRQVDVGNVVTPGQPLLAIVSDQLWVTANFKETQLTRMHPGQRVQVEIDAFPGVVFPAHVDSIQRGTGSFFSALPAENATGNYVKVVQRVPVKIVFDSDRLRDYPVGPGLSVHPDVQIP